MISPAVPSILGLHYHYRLCYNHVMERDAVLNVRIPKDVKEAVRRAGEADDGRSISGMAVKILRLWCIGAGYLKPTAEPKPQQAKRSRS